MILVVAEHDNTELNVATLNVVTAAKEINNDIHILVAGSECSGVAQQASAIEGIHKVLHADSPFLANGLAENVAKQVLGIAGDYTHIIFAATTSGKNVAPRVAANLDVAQISEIVSVIAKDTFQRPIFAGNAIATVQSVDSTQVLTVRTTAFYAASSQGGAASIESIEAVADFGKTVFVNRQTQENDRPDLASASIVVSGGRGLGSAENFGLLEQLADKLEAALGASRAAVDAGYVSNDLQVGQTGKIVAPQLYIAVGISGAIQHLAGMKDSKIIVAINKDSDAPIFEVADYGLVADLFEAVPELISLL